MSVMSFCWVKSAAPTWLLLLFTPFWWRYCREGTELLFWSPFSWEAISEDASRSTFFGRESALDNDEESSADKACDDWDVLMTLLLKDLMFKPKKIHLSTEESNKEDTVKQKWKWPNLSGCKAAQAQCGLFSVWWCPRLWRDCFCKALGTRCCPLHFWSTGSLPCEEDTDAASAPQTTATRPSD